MESLQTQGIITHAIPFKEYDRIVTLFTPEAGLIKAVVKGAFSQKNLQGASTTPLTVVEATFTRGKSELYSCKDLTPLDAQHAVRKNLSTLQAACDMLKTVSSTQQPGKPAQQLYMLLLTYLKKLSQAEYPLNVSLSFKLKTLRHEGMLELNQKNYSEEEHNILLALSYSLDFSLIASLEIPLQLKQKIDSLFETVKI